MPRMADSTEVELPIGGMTCAACARSVERGLQRAQGVSSVHVNFATRTAEVKYNAGATNLEALIAAVEDTGYEVPKHAQEIEDEIERKALQRRVIIGFLFAAPVFVLGMLEIAPWWQLPLTLAVLAWPGRGFFVDAWTALRHGQANMNTLIAAGTGTAFLYSAAILLGGGMAMEVYFESAAVIVVLVLFGRLLESRVRGKASDAVRKLRELQPPLARLVRNGVEEEVPVAELAVGDVVRVRPGERLPADGTILQGKSEINEAMLTGESMPASKKPGSSVYAGTVNGNGGFDFTATKAGRATALGQIIDLVKKAQGSRAPIARLADVISSYFTVTVLGIAAVTLLVWLVLGTPGAAITHAVAVLIIACPCAMGLATPAAIMAGTGRGAEQGILIKSGEALEAAARITTVVLDKTGTITAGNPVVKLVTPKPGVDGNDLLRLAAAVERWSEHPAAIAIRRSVEGQEVAPSTDFKAIPGEGAEATVGGKRVFVGKGEAGRIAVSVEGALLGEITIEDQPKPEAASAVKRLQRMSLDVWMITGDHEKVALEIAAEVGIPADHVLAGVTPDRKSREVARLREGGARVAMAGDGINDAPALAGASTGIAVGVGTGIAVEAAGIILTSGNLNGVPGALALARQTLAVIQQNLFWAFAYNALGIPLAAGVFHPWIGWNLSPMVASAAMAMSSISVLLNSLRLRRFPSAA